MYPGGTFTRDVDKDADLLGTMTVSLQWVHDQQDSVEVRLNHAALAYLRKNWPNPVHLSPTRLGDEFTPEGKAFVRIIQTLIDDGLLSVEFFLIGAGDEPTARDAILTRKGVTAALEF